MSVNMKLFQVTRTPRYAAANNRLEYQREAQKRGIRTKKKCMEHFWALSIRHMQTASSPLPVSHTQSHVHATIMI